MSIETLRAAARGPLERSVGSGAEPVLRRFDRLLEAIGGIVGDPAAPPRCREKAEALLSALSAAHERHGDRLFQPAWLLNVVGDALGVSGFLHQSVVEFLQVGLYFFGLDQIERKWSRRAVVYSAVHADLVMRQVSRDGLKELVRTAQQRQAEGRAFCLTYHYLNQLRRAYWDACRQSTDALDQAVEGDASAVLRDREGAPPSASAAEAAPAADARMAVVWRVFSEDLTARQQWIYLAKMRQGQEVPDAASSPLEQILAHLASPLPDDALGWKEIAAKAGINEKSAKREYLRALHTLLHETGIALFGRDWLPSGLVRRVLDQIRSVMAEKDLRLKQSTGRGLGILTEKWQVALRFVLNSERVSA